MPTLSDLVQPADQPLNVKLPVFLKVDPALWISRVDAHFEYFRITSQQARFHYTAAVIEEPFIYELRDVLMNPPEDAPYDALREAILTRFSASEQQRLRLLIAGESLGDRTPSQFLRHLQQLLGPDSDRFDAALMREFFLRRLPPDVQLVLSSSDSTVSLSTLAAMADRMVERMSLPVNSLKLPQNTEREPCSPPFSGTANTHCTLSDLDSLRAEIQALRAEIQALAPQRRARERSYSRERGRRWRSHSRDELNADGLCYYHARFGDKATKCCKGCRRNPKASPNL